MTGPSIWVAENERNARNRALYTDIIKEVYGADQVGIGHHLMFSVNGEIDEQPSADTMIFDHHVAKKIWGDEWSSVLMQLAVVPIAERDLMVAQLYYARNGGIRE